MDTNSKLDTKNLVSAASEMKHVQAWKPVASTIHSAVYAMFFVKNRFTKLPENPPNYLKYGGWGKGSLDPTTLLGPTVCATRILVNFGLSEKLTNWKKSSSWF